MATTSSMFMYSLTIQPPTAITQAIIGQFSGIKEQQIVTASGSKLSIHEPDSHQGKIRTLYSQDVFGIIRSLAAFRLAGSSKDYIIIGSDSGRITIIEYVPSQNRFNRIHLETFGKSGIRRVVPGQYLAVDPKGRACLIASVEKNKLVYVLNRNAQAELTISSPLEAHRPQTLVFAMTALDVGYENPIFAALEVEYTESDLDPTGSAYEELEKLLVYYELDLGLNHVVRKWAEPVDRTSSILFQVPGGADGPSGVLVCAEGSITYRHSNQDPFRVPIPRRIGATENPDRKRTIVAGVVHKMRRAFFCLLQTEDGDLFKVTMDMAEDGNGQPTGEVQRLKLKYFDTVPIASSLCILKNGFLFVASETGNHHFYQFEKLGDDDDETEFTSDDFSADPSEPLSPIFFQPRPAENLNLVESVNSMNPLMSCKVTNLTEDDAPQFYTLCGTGARSTFRTLKHGLEVSEIVESELPSVPSAVWTTKLTRNDQYDAYIILSFSNGTLVLSIGETVEEVTDTGFLPSAPTLAVQQLGEDSLIQVHPRGIRHIHADRRVNEWPAPQHRSIVAAATNERQVAVALSSGEIVYFEMDSDGSLAEYDEKREMSGTVTSLSLGEVPPGRVRSSFLAVGCDDSTVRILSLDPESTLENKSVQALTSAPSALSIMPMIDSTSGGSTLYLHIGLYSGIYLRTVLDEVTGELSDTRTRFLGLKPVKLFNVSVKEQKSVLALSSRPWLGYSDIQTRNFMLTPLDYVPLEWSWNFSSEQCVEGMVGIQGQNLRIFSIEKLDNNLLQESISLAYTPRHFVRHPEHALFYVIEADNNILAPTTKAKLIQDSKAVNGESAELPPEDFGYARGTGHWASCIQVVDPINRKGVLSRIELEENEAAISVAAVPFSSQDDETFLVVGTGQNMIANPPSSSGGYIHIYRFQEEGKELEFIHKTKVESPPQALLPFQGRLIAGIGTDLRIYDLGMKQLLRKCQAEVTPRMIVGLQTQGSRIVVSDVQESVTYVVYKFQENRLIPFADDMIPRWTTCTAMVDYETVAGGDKFGNLWLLRCPQKASEEADEDGSGAHLIHERQYLQGAPNRLGLVVHYYPQDIPTSLQKTQLVAGGRDIVVWTGLQGTIGLLIPFVSRDDVDFFQSLEMQLTSQNPPLAGRDHLIYRSYYAPAKGTIDGDLCETYFTLPNDKKLMIAGELDRSVREIERKISVSPEFSFCSDASLVAGLIYAIGHAYKSGVLKSSWA
ncbi:pre-mRNA-splicing factor rse1 [Ophidiomyces ophidiicola]|uniref:Pre-mRNA-splicing factor rse1 n=1 Tax=Ophidiomyces ophidiicola TaxID=1387563 RepID=A0ACB8V400_9EURO|nr:pre-mRNA-splicing factor rse1 [Ophidiomyces ophidiicola]KAI1929558.1 pre-mRNA-splicing factor rse1 [Ophidiomyces ophidiicola]KAI1943412.1 pre-mRNA-splicing factor rse1 [Ophidiomyces ophidiicola]KAI1968436.1 pre-mRNA-splicing factor rse1 [Ophidiomyces ophidiicola]KAI1970259.1 pre-mRNA-splicing factor rse1 [Ophidiomyces ophidiicola]